MTVLRITYHVFIEVSAKTHMQHEYVLTSSIAKSLGAIWYTLCVCNCQTKTSWNDNYVYKGHNGINLSNHTDTFFENCYVLSTENYYVISTEKCYFISSENCDVLSTENTSYTHKHYSCSMSVELLS